MLRKLPEVLKVPLSFAVCFAFLFYYLGVSFFSGIGVFIISFFFNLYFGMLIGKYWSSIMTVKDERMNITTEVLSNIKMIKLYSWISTFYHKIN